ncbi:MAG: hypothetical protein M3Z75_30680 [Actinomycetota bacterium]|nr:hypothetical protein [Actinomycetota bacterium]
MAVQLASELDPAAEAGRLGQWAASYRPSGGTGNWLGPRREGGERWQAVIRGVVRDEIGQRDLADPGLIGHRRAFHPVPHAWISPQRAIIGRGRRVLESWRLDELSGVRVLDDLTGVVLLATEPHPYDDDRSPALLSDIVPWYSKWAGQPPPGYGRRRVDVDWLKFEAVFAVRRDGLEEWTRDLPSRLSRIVRQAQDAPAQ